MVGSCGFWRGLTSHHGGKEVSTEAEHMRTEEGTMGKTGAELAAAVERALDEARRGM